MLLRRRGAARSGAARPGAARLLHVARQLGDSRLDACHTGLDSCSTRRQHLLARKKGKGMVSKLRTLLSTGVIVDILLVNQCLALRSRLLLSRFGLPLRPFRRILPDLRPPLERWLI